MEIFSKKYGCFIDVADWWESEGVYTVDSDAIKLAGKCPKCGKNSDLASEEGFVWCQNCEEWEWNTDKGWHRIE